LHDALPICISTAEIFKCPDLTRDTKPITMWDFTKWLQGPRVVNSFATFGRNDLEPVVIKAQPIVAETARLLNQAGFNARMTGAGSCFFVESSTPEMAGVMQRSEEHTSELQSRFDLVCRLLLEKKKT